MKNSKLIQLKWKQEPLSRSSSPPSQKYSTISRTMPHSHHFSCGLQSLVPWTHRYGSRSLNRLYPKKTFYHLTTPFHLRKPVPSHLRLPVISMFHSLLPSASHLLARHHRLQPEDRQEICSTQTKDSSQCRTASVADDVDAWEKGSRSLEPTYVLERKE
jgi:hypothetical protein